MTTPLTRDAEAAPAQPLRLSLADVAELAKVRRPVASMWRTRFASGDDAFPTPTSHRASAPLFDAVAVAEWLVRTGHGNNPDAVADAASSASPTDLDWADPDHIAELDALIALSSRADGLASMTGAALLAAAQTADPADDFLQHEVARHVDRGTNWTRFADDLIDAAYSPAGALRLTATRRSAAASGQGSAGPLTAAALDLVTEVTAALAQRSTSASVVLDPGIDDSTALRIATAVGDDAALVVTPSAQGRSIRRRLTVEGIWLEDAQDTTRAVRIARVPASPGDDIERMLNAADDFTLSLDSDDAAVLVGPTRALIDPLPRAAGRVRDDILRSGRLRAAVRLPHGLVTAAPREALALWVLGAPTGDVPLAERFTAVADLVDRDLTPATRSDLVSDVLAGMGSQASVLARKFRFARLVRTASLVAQSGALLAAPTAKPSSRPATLAARLDAAAQAAAQDIPAHLGASTGTGTGTLIAPATLADLIAAGHARIIPGTRIASRTTNGTGLAIVTSDDLTSPTHIGQHRGDPLEFARQHPSAQLTRPGDVIFRTSPTAAAWVDHDGSKVVAYPARVLRVTAADPGGLVAELVAADIATQPAGPGAWKRWMLRRVAPASIAPLRTALKELAAARAELESRVAHLDHYIDTLTAAVAAGAVTLTAPTADAPETQ